MRTLTSIVTALTTALAIGSGCATTVNTVEDEPARSPDTPLHTPIRYSASYLIPPVSEVIRREMEELGAIAKREGCGEGVYYDLPLDESHRIITPPLKDGLSLKFEYFKAGMLGPESYCISVIPDQKSRETAASLRGSCAQYNDTMPGRETERFLRITGPYVSEFLDQIRLVRNSLPESCRN